MALTMGRLSGIKVSGPIKKDAYFSAAKAEGSSSTQTRIFFGVHPVPTLTMIVNKYFREAY
jgi:hypothetical protein